jgi:YtkA-like
VSRAHAAPARPSPRRKIHNLPRGDAGTLLAMFYGSAIAVLVVAAGVGALLTEGIKTGTAGSIVADETQHEASLESSPADISITAEHLGNQRLGIEARVTMNEQRRPLQQARVEAYLDMTQMPGAHMQGPLDLRPGDRPGVYTTVATVPMLGDYEIRVEMHEPVHAEAKQVVSVGVVGSGQ